MITTFFRIFRAVRTGFLGLLIAGTAWITIVPPTQQEITQLRLPADAMTYQAPQLMQMRFAKLMLGFAPDRLMRMVAEDSEGQFSQDEIKTALQIIADGPSIAPANRETSATFVSSADN